jgi:hypothetical protein
MAVNTWDKEVRVGIDKPNNYLIYGASLVSILLSLFTLRKNPTISNFIGLWAPTILGLGILMKENQLLELSKKQLSGS